MVQEIDAGAARRLTEPARGLAAGRPRGGPDRRRDGAGGRGWSGRLAALWRFASDARGAATTEYALLLALVVVVLIGTLTSLGAALNEKLKDIIDQVSGAS